MKSHVVRIGVLVMFALLLCGFACNANTTHKVNQANKEISDVLNQLEQQSESLYNAKTIDAGDATAIANFVIEASADHKVLTGQLRAFNSQPGTVDQDLGFIQQFADKVHGINLHLNSKQAQDAATLFFATFDAAITTLRATLQSIKTSSIPSREPMRAGLDPAEEVALGLAAFSSLSKLIASWFASGQLTDQQLQDAADAEDDATGKAALSFVKSLKP